MLWYEQRPKIMAVRISLSIVLITLLFLGTLGCAAKDQPIRLDSVESTNLVEVPLAADPVVPYLLPPTTTGSVRYPYVERYECGEGDTCRTKITE